MRINVLTPTAFFKAGYLHITVAFGGHIESRVLAQYNRYWEPLWKQST